MQTPVCLTVSQYQDYLVLRTLFETSNLKKWFKPLFCMSELVGGLRSPDKKGDNLLEENENLCRERKLNLLRKDLLRELSG